MKSSKIFTIAAVLIAAALSSVAFINPRKPAIVNDKPGFAVIELFTSEGCSSCPPADELVAKIQTEMKDKPVYILAFHVDYWNRLGWKDVFSSADFSDRQRDYARYLHLGQIYTPQIVVNGRTEFVGSEESTLRKAIKTTLQTNAMATLSLNVESLDANRASLKYTTSAPDKNMTLLIAVVQKNAQTNVARGENSGRKLSHVQIVRKLQTVPLNERGGIVNVALPVGFNTQNWEITGFLQNAQNGEITGASRALFAGPETAMPAKNSK